MIRTDRGGTGVALQRPAAEPSAVAKPMSTMADSLVRVGQHELLVAVLGREALGEVPRPTTSAWCTARPTCRPAASPAARRARRRRRSRRSRWRTAWSPTAPASIDRPLVRRHGDRLLDGLARPGEQRDAGLHRRRRRRWRRRSRRRALLAAGRDAGAEPRAGERRRRPGPPASTARPSWRTRPAPAPASRGRRRRCAPSATDGHGEHREPADDHGDPCPVGGGLARPRRRARRPTRRSRCGRVRQAGARLGVEVDQRLVAGPARPQARRHGDAAGRDEHERPTAAPGATRPSGARRTVARSASSAGPAAATSYADVTPKPVAAGDLGAADLELPGVVERRGPK